MKAVCLLHVLFLHLGQVTLLVALALFLMLVDQSLKVGLNFSPHSQHT